MTAALYALIIFCSVIFAMTNGFIVGGSLVSAVITTRALSPLAALLCVAACEVGGIFLFGQQVVRTLGQDLVVLPSNGPPLRLLIILLSAVGGALGWNLFVWRLALPTSSGHALVGGLTGSFLGAYGMKGIHWAVFGKIFILLGVVPFAGALIGYALARVAYWIGEFLTPAWNRFFRVVQVGALAGVALTHGSNDGQKALVIIALATAARAGMSASNVVPWPMMLLCGTALATGLMFGSRRIIQSVGQKLYRIQPLQAVCAQTSTMLLVGVSSLGGYPMSSSQLMSTSLLGAGVAVQPSAVRWDLVGDIGLAWLVTLPTAGLFAVALSWTMQRIFHVVS